MSDPTPADIPSLVAELRELLAKATPRSKKGWSAKEIATTLEIGVRSRPELQRWHNTTNFKGDGELIAAMVNALPALLDALSPKEAELVKPPREYEVSGDAVGGIPAGMVAWKGEYACEVAAPADWDGGPVMFADGSIDEGQDWDWGSGHLGGTIVAYTPKVLTASHDAARERIARIIDPYGDDDGSHVSYMAWQIALEKADAILAALPTTDGSPR